MYLKELVEELEKHDPKLVVPWGFDGADWHSDRGDYSNLAFVPRDNVTIGSMLSGVRSAFGGTLYGYKGGEYEVTEYTKVLIGEDSSVCGGHISPLLIRYMIAAEKASVPTSAGECRHRAWIDEAGKGHCDCWPGTAPGEAGERP